MLDTILKRDGLSIRLFEKLSYESGLGIRLKKNLHYFDKTLLFNELLNVHGWYAVNVLLHSLTIDYRIKSIQSAMLKYERYYPDHQAAKVFNDMLGFRTLCDNYEDVLQIAGYDNIRVADMSNGNNWLHKYVYKRKYKNQVGYRLRQEYENGKIKNESEFKEVLGHVLSDCEEVR